MNGKVNAVTLGLANLFTKKQVEIAVTDLSGQIDKKSKPIPFSISGSNYQCGIPFSEAIEYCKKGMNQVNATLFTNAFNSSAKTLELQTDFAYFIQYATNLMTGEYIWIRVGFKMLDGTIVKLQFNPDESVTRINDDTTGIAATQTYVQNAIAPVQEDVTALEGKIFANQFTIMGGRVQSRKTAAEIEKEYLNFGFSVVCFMTATMFDGTDFSPIYVCTAMDSVSMTSADGKSYSARKFYFGDNIPPIICDSKLATITVDPDWVAPTAE